MATVVFDLRFAVLAILAVRGTMEDPFELVTEGHLESCDERDFGMVVDTRRCLRHDRSEVMVERGTSQLQTNPTVGRDAEVVQARRAG